ncbi:hypothetical protein SAMN05216553_101736 [Lentzea fradiae]|uniref:Uncharacterized protein n=1 Tax=Lentzea fradiae TaxID=200378 RepID=A0A1G7LAC6_9PSEU|nr:hypothetical protein [Lentzea fradiae]SDF45949.1 hypothetical protein SAMN05216553_101736 [Lentzea fradiae]
MPENKDKSGAKQSLRQSLASFLHRNREQIGQAVEAQAAVALAEAGAPQPANVPGLVNQMMAAVAVSPQVEGHVANALAQVPSQGPGGARGGLSAAIRKEREEVLQVVNMNLAVLATQKELLSALRTAVDKLQDHEHITYSKELVSAKKDALSLYVKKSSLESQIKKYEEWTTKVLSTHDETKLRAVLDEHKSVQAKFMDEVTSTSTSVTKIAHSVTSSSVDIAIKAINVNADPNVLERLLGIADSLTELALTLGGEVPEPYTKIAITAVSGVKPWAVMAGRSLYRRVMVEMFKSEHGKAAVFAKLQPLDLAKKLAGDQKALVAAIVNTAGIGLGEVPGWSLLIKPGILSVVDGFFDARIELAKKWLATEEANKAGDLLDALNAAMYPGGNDVDGWVDQVVARFTSGLGSIQAELRKVPARLAAIPEQTLDAIQATVRDPLSIVEGTLDFTNKALSVTDFLTPVITAIVRKIFVMLPLTPAAEVYSGADLAAEIQAVYLAGHDATPLAPGGATTAEYEVPTRTKEGHSVISLLTSEPEEEAGRRFLWARVYTTGLDTGNREELEGRIFLPDWEFEDTTPPGNLAGLPTRTDKGIPIHQFKNVDGGIDKMEVRVDNLWGKLTAYGDDGDEQYRFTPDRPARIGPEDGPASQKKWSARTVDAAGYTENGTHVPGKWYHPFTSTFLFVADGASGDELWGEWVSATNPTAGGPRGNGGEFGLRAHLETAVPAGSKPPHWSRYN